MHILTKVFVLFAAVLSILMAALSIAYTVNTDRIVADYSNAQSQAEQALADLGSFRSLQGNLMAALEQDALSARNELASRDADIRRLEAANSELRIGLRSAESDRASITSKIAELGVAVETQAKIIDEYKNELTRLRQAELDYRDDKIDLEKQLSDLESQVIVYEQVKRALEEQLEEVRQTLASARDGSTRATPAARDTPTDIQGTLIRGTVDQVMTDPATGELLLKINLGSNDRVRENNRLYVHRDGKTFLGELVVFEVDLNHSIGRMTYTVEGETVRAGDQVLSRLGN